MQSSALDNVYTFPLAALTLSFDDAIVAQTREIWTRVMGDEAQSSSFMDFEDKQETGDLDEEV